MVGLAPLSISGLHELAQPAPQRRVNGVVMVRPLIRTVEDLAVDIVLALIGRGVPPAHGGDRR